MKRTGLRFHIEGEYCRRLKHLLDPNDEDWVVFGTEDINPFKHKHFTIWSQYDDPLSYPDERERMVNEVVSVIAWLRHKKDWDGFCATLWLMRPKHIGDEVVFKWESC